MADNDAPELNQAYECEKSLDYIFKDILLLWEALQADGALISRGSMPRYRAGNKRLAIVGDRVLELLLSLKWYDTYQDRLAYTTLSQSITSNKSLDLIGRRNHLDRYIILPDSAKGVASKTMTATVEAIIGAAYIDGGLEAAKTVLESLRIEAIIKAAIAARGDEMDQNKAAKQFALKRKRSQTDELESSRQVTKKKKSSAGWRFFEGSAQSKPTVSTPKSSPTQPQKERNNHCLVM
ncbi:MAG: hypothetical protein LQ346_000992 [Caloplaca aetnensis]|nr:MAG: hypothetical protein LQ346_000992 [Caloplaca aetnensis]